jgi:hypothetical protein
MSDIQIIPFEWAYLDSAARLYMRAYGVRPYENMTAEDISREVIVNHQMRDSFIGSVAVDDKHRVVGFIWGYDTPTENERMMKLVEKSLGKEWTEHTFIVEALAIHPDFAEDEALARRMHDAFVDRLREESYQRVRTRMDVARMDSLPMTLQDAGWDILQRLPHVMWLGMTI